MKIRVTKALLKITCGIAMAVASNGWAVDLITTCSTASPVDGGCGLCDTDAGFGIALAACCIAHGGVPSQGGFQCDFPGKPSESQDRAWDDCAYEFCRRVDQGLPIFPILTGE